MDMRKTFSFFLVIIFTVVLAACGSTDEIEQSEDPAAVSVGGDNAGSGDGSNGSGADAYGAGDSSALTDSDLASGDLEALAAQGKLTTVYYFAFDNDTLSSENREALDMVAKVLKASKIKVKLNGHADERGTREYNLALSERRAQSVKDYLAIQGVDRSQIMVVGYGEEKPAVAQSNESAWSQNRRVELVR
jgi:peptidoglycan-associated lipoprotein